MRSPPRAPGPVRFRRRPYRRFYGRALGAVLLSGALLAPAAAGEAAGQAAPPEARTVVLLHGLGRTPRSMLPLEDALRDQGYRVINLGYPSTEQPIAALVDTVHSELTDCCRADRSVDFVTHSLGGILVRAYAARYGEERIGRVVMLSPPNGGSELVDRLDGLGPVAWLLGPAFQQLGTDEGSVPQALGPAHFEVGVITGDATLNPLFSRWVPGEDDGKVSVESARLEGSDGFLVVPFTHAFIMRRKEVIIQVLAFLGSGRFLHRPGTTSGGP